jgi:hypothetical protein
VPPEAASAFFRAARHVWGLRELTLDGLGESREVMTPCPDAAPLTAACRKALTRARGSAVGDRETCLVPRGVRATPGEPRGAAAF